MESLEHKSANIPSINYIKIQRFGKFVFFMRMMYFSVTDRSVLGKRSQTQDLPINSSDLNTI